MLENENNILKYFVSLDSALSEAKVLLRPRRKYSTGDIRCELEDKSCEVNQIPSAKESSKKTDNIYLKRGAKFSLFDNMKTKSKVSTSFHTLRRNTGKSFSKVTIAEPRNLEFSGPSFSQLTSFITTRNEKVRQWLEKKEEEAANQRFTLLLEKKKKEQEKMEREERNRVCLNCWLRAKEAKEKEERAKKEKVQLMKKLESLQLEQRKLFNQMTYRTCFRVICKQTDYERLVRRQLEKLKVVQEEIRKVKSYMGYPTVENLLPELFSNKTQESIN